MLKATSVGGNGKDFLGVLSGSATSWKHYCDSTAIVENATVILLQ